MSAKPRARPSWPRNALGGFKVVTRPILKSRHDGVRCYGEHRGGQCFPYDFSKEPPVPQAVLVRRRR